MTQEMFIQALVPPRELSVGTSLDNTNLIKSRFCCNRFRYRFVSFSRDGLHADPRPLPNNDLLRELP